VNNTGCKLNLAGIGISAGRFGRRRPASAMFEFLFSLIAFCGAPWQFSRHSAVNPLAERLDSISSANSRRLRRHRTFVFMRDQVVIDRLSRSIAPASMTSPDAKTAPAYKTAIVGQVKVGVLTCPGLWQERRNFCWKDRCETMFVRTSTGHRFFSSRKRGKSSTGDSSDIVNSRRMVGLHSIIMVNTNLT